jgi:hypothetical protein
MTRVIAVVGSFVVLGAGVFAAVALAGGAKPFDVSTSTSTGISTNTDTSTGTSTDPSTVPAKGSKVWICHRTGSRKHPYHLIHVSARSLHAHFRHGDVAPGAGNSCPSSRPSTLNSPTTTTIATTAPTTTSDGDQSHGKHGNKEKHDKGGTETDPND